MAGFVKAGLMNPSPIAISSSSWGEDDELPRCPGHGDIAVDRSFDALAEGFWFDEDDQVEFESLR